MAGAWEYRVVNFKGSWLGSYDDLRLQAELNRLGSEGWEAFATTEAVWSVRLKVLLRRPLPTSPPPPPVPPTAQANPWQPPGHPTA